MQSKNAIGNLKNRYLAVLKKCNLMNVFGSLAVAGMLTAGSVGIAQASFEPTIDKTETKEYLKTLMKDDGAGGEVRVYIDAEVDAMSSSYLVEPFDSENESSYFTTFTTQEENASGEYEEFTYGIKLKGRDYNGVDNTDTVSTVNELIIDYVTKQTSTGTEHPYDRIENVTSTDAHTFNITTNTLDADGNPTILYFAVKNASGDLITTTNNRTDSPSGDINENFIGNSATQYGGAIFNDDIRKISSIRGDFIGNSATESGGAIYNEMGNIETITGDFIGNSAHGGGAIYNQSSAVRTITGDFTGNSTTTDGGAIHSDNNSTIETITGDFIGNTASDDGGAIFNDDSTIGTITGDFIGNSADYGGAIANDDNSTISTITGDFIGNSSIYHGGAIYNDDYSTITSITGDFIGNSASYESARGGAIYNSNNTISTITGDFIGNSADYGGAIYNSNSTISTITGDFIGNSSEKSGGAIFNIASTIGTITGDFIGNSTINYGGAIYNDYNSTISTITGDFIGNSSENRGGAIYTTSDLNFAADSENYKITDNYTSDDNGASKDYNAIFFADNNYFDDTIPTQNLNFKLLNNGTYTLNDNVSTDIAYNVNIIGDESTSDIFYLNNELYAVVNVVVENATLQMASYYDDTSSAIYSNSTVNITNSNLIIKHAENESKSIIHGTLNINNGSSLTVDSGILDLSYAYLTVDSQATDFSTAENGKLIANAYNFGTFAEDGSFIQNGTVEKTLDNNGNLTLLGITDTVPKAESQAVYEELLKNALTLTGNTGTITFAELDMSDTYSLTTVINGYANGSVTAGTLSGNKVVDVTQVLNNAVTSSTVEASSTLSIEGGTGLDVLIEGDMTNNGTVNLYSGSVNGAFTTGANSKTYVYKNTIFKQDVTTDGIFVIEYGANANFKEDFTVSNSGKLYIVDSTSFEKSLNIADNGSLDIFSTLDVSDIEFSVASTASAFTTRESGTLIASADDFAIINKDTGAIDTSKASVKKALENFGSLVLENLNFTEMEYVSYTNFLASAKDATSGFVTGAGTITLDGVDINTTNATADDITDGTSLSDKLFQGGTIGKNQSETIVIGGTSGNTINNAKETTLTGQGDANGVLVDGNLTNNNGSTVNLGTQGSDSTITKDFNNEGIVNIVGNITVKDTTSTNTNSGSSNVFNVKNESTYHTASFKADSSTTINVGEAIPTTGGVLYANELVLDGGVLKLTHSFTGADIADSSKAILNELPNDINGHIVVGKSSYLVLGDTDVTWAEESFNASGLTWGANGNSISSALFVRAPQTLSSTGSLLISATLPNAPLTTNEAIFGANSLFVVDANGVGESAALSATSGTLSVDGSSQLLIVDGKAKQEVVIVDGFTDNSQVDKNAWGINDIEQNLLLLTSQGLLVDSTEFDDATGKYIVTLKAAFLPSEYKKLDTSVGQVMLNLGDGIGFDTNSTNEGIKFYSRAIDSLFIDVSNKDLVAATLEGSMQIGAAAGTATTAFNVVGSTTTPMLGRAGLSSYSSSDLSVQHLDNTDNNGLNAGSAQGNTMSNGLALWVSPLYNHTHTSGYEAGHFKSGFSSDYAGLAIGSDYTFNNQYRLGIALSVGSGSSTSNGDFNKTTNDFDSLGVSLYGAMTINDFIISADMGYTAVNNDVEYEVPSSMQMSNLKADVDSQVFTVGLTGEYTFETESVDITPHAGVRYTNVSTENYSTTSAGGVVNNVKSDNQGVFSIPVGVTFSKDIVTENGWAITPKADVGVVASFGDTHVNSTTSIPTVAGLSSLEMRNVDNFAFSGGVGVEVAKDNLSFGLNYNLKASEHETSHGVNVGFTYKF